MAGQEGAGKSQFAFIFFSNFFLSYMIDTDMCYRLYVRNFSVKENHTQWLLYGVNCLTEQ